MASKTEDKEEEPTEKIQSPLPEATDPYPSRECPELRRERDDYPEVVPPDDKNYHGTAGPPIAPDGDYERMLEKSMGRRTCFRLRRRGLVILLLLVIIVIAAVIGGSVGGLLMGKRRVQSGPLSIEKSPAERSISAVQCGRHIFLVYQDYKGDLGIFTYEGNSSTWHNSRPQPSLWDSDFSMNTPISLGLVDPDTRDQWILHIHYINENNTLYSDELHFTRYLDDVYGVAQSYRDITLVPSDSKFAAVTTPAGDISFLFISNEAGAVSQFNGSSIASPPPPIHDLRTYASSPMAAIYNNSDCQLYWINQQGYLEGGSKNIFFNGSWAGGMSSV
ncbi:hypothetical protein FQN50_007734 [Emmonsiellopsis sp. PD_5]|nr:hypothetical protein FQN50_007734 [Emmonsiellopsis sp. PD_5]